jgi:hypothetical protein
LVVFAAVVTDSPEVAVEAAEVVWFVTGEDEVFTAEVTAAVETDVVLVSVMVFDAVGSVKFSIMLLPENLSFPMSLAEDSFHIPTPAMTAAHIPDTA